MINVLCNFIFYIDRINIEYTQIQNHLVELRPDSSFEWSFEFQKFPGTGSYILFSHLFSFMEIICPCQSSCFERRNQLSNTGITRAQNIQMASFTKSSIRTFSFCIMFHLQTLTGMPLSSFNSLLPFTNKKMCWVILTKLVITKMVTDM